MPNAIHELQQIFGIMSHFLDDAAGLPFARQSFSSVTYSFSVHVNDLELNRERRKVLNTCDILLDDWMFKSKVSIYLSFNLIYLKC